MLSSNMLKGKKNPVILLLKRCIFGMIVITISKEYNFCTLRLVELSYVKPRTEPSVKDTCFATLNPAEIS